MRQALHVRFPVYIKFRVDRIRVPRRDPIPHVREPALIHLPAQLRGHTKRAHKRAHRPVVRQHRPDRRAALVLRCTRHHFALSPHPSSLAPFAIITPVALITFVRAFSLTLALTLTNRLRPWYPHWSTSSSATTK